MTCAASIILSFLQDCLDNRHTPSTLKVYVAAVSVFHSPIDYHSVGEQSLVAGVLRGARWLHRSRPNLVAVWDLSLVLSSHSGPPFKLLHATELKVLSFEMALLLALACRKRVGDLHSLSTDTACIVYSVKMTVVRSQM